MGTFSIPAEVGDQRGERWERVELLVDTEATYTMLPASLLRRLGVPPVERSEFRVANGRTVEYDVGDAQMRIEGRPAFVRVVFADENVRVLGATALEVFGYAVDPVRRGLVRVQGLAMASQETKP